jgi:hypothetical protein
MKPPARDVFLVVYLLLQVALPARYYLRVATAPADAVGVGYDERFAWRMFSPIRMLRCDTDYRAGGEEVKLSAEVHSAWTTLLQRGRPDVVDAVSAQLCEKHGGPVTLKMRCRELGGGVVTVHDGSADVCAEGAP